MSTLETAAQKGGDLREAVENIIKAAVARGASDLHIKSGDVFRARINGVTGQVAFTF